jgi:hypothetical protein
MAGIIIDNINELAGQLKYQMKFKIIQEKEIIMEGKIWQIIKEELRKI